MESSCVIDIGSNSWLSGLLPQVISLAREAGEAIMTLYGEEAVETRAKHDGSELTQADLASDKILLHGLAQVSPQLPVLSEESAEIPFDQRGSWEYFWMIDPLDGTKEFVNRNGDFTVNIALIEKNRPVLGTVYAPAKGKLYFAARGEGAYKIEGGTVSQIRVAQVAPRTMRVVISRSHEEDLDRFVERIEDCQLSRMGSSLKLCLVAEGDAHLYPRTGPTMEWDTAAAQCILEEAGGSIEDLEGNSLTYNKCNLRNPGFLAMAAKCCVSSLMTRAPRR